MSDSTRANSEALTSELARVILDRLKFASQTRISHQVMQSAKLHAWEDIATRQLVLALEAEVLAEKLVSETIAAKTKVPASWWQHFKMTNCYIGLGNDPVMRWFERKWPVKYVDREVKVTFTRYAKFPEATIKVPELGRPIIFEQWSEPRWTNG